MSANINLKEISLIGGDITTVNLPKSTHVERIQINQTKLSAIDISNSPNLRRLDLEGNNLQSLDVSKNKELRYISVVWNAIKQLAMNKILEDLPSRTAADNATIWIDDRSSGPLGNMVERNEKPNAEAIAKGKSKNWNLFSSTGVL